MTNLEKLFIGFRVKAQVKATLQAEADRKWRGNLSAMLEHILESKARQIQKREEK